MRRYGLGLMLLVILALLALIARRVPTRPPELVQGPDVLASVNPDGGDLRCEPSVAVFDTTIVVTWNDSYGGKLAASAGMPIYWSGTAIGWSMSTDRGQTFQFGGYLPVAREEVVSAGADSRVAADEEGNFYLEVLSDQHLSNHIQVYVMDKASLGTWRQLPDAVMLDLTTGGEYLDKPAMHVDGGRIGIVYTEKLLDSGPAINFVRSTDRGQTWHQPIALSAASARVRTGAAVLLDGNTVLGAWTEADTASPDASEIWVSISTDGGTTFGPAALVYRLRQPFVPPTAYRMALGQMAYIANDVSIARVITTTGETTYLLSFIEGTALGSDVLVMSYKATTGQWSEPRTVGSGTGDVNIFASLAVVGHTPAVLHYSRPDTDGTITDVTVTLLHEGRPAEDRRLSTEGSDWATTRGDMEYAPFQRIYGDYITLASDGRSLVAAWTDGRLGVPRIHSRVLTEEPASHRVRTEH